jgi:cyclic pyranopterin phosphate synthase
LPIRDLCLTTNGSLLAGQVKALAEAGLGRITVSVDAIDELTFRRMTDGHKPLSRVLEGIDAARRFGLTPVKINMVVQRGLNEHAILPMAAWARREGLELRFIEYMDVGCSNGWKASDVFAAHEIRERIHAQWPIDARAPDQPNATAEQFTYRDGAGRIGIVAAVTRPFCGGCSRARVSSLGELFPCLFAPWGIDLAQPLRDGTDLRTIIAAGWHQRSDRYSELRATLPQALPRPEMAAIGG